MVLLLLGLFTVFQNPSQRSSSQQIAQQIPFSQFLDLVDHGSVRAVDIDGSEIQVSTTQGETFWTVAPNDPGLVQRLHDKRIVITAHSSQTSRPRDTGDWLLSLVTSWLPFIFLIGTWVFLSRQMRRGGASPLGPFCIPPPPTAAALDDPAHWRGHAGEARATADRLADLQSKRQMLEIARSYEYLAQRAEEKQRGPGSSS